MRKLTLTNHVQSDTTVLENEFIDHYMAEANGEYVKVYLILLRHLNEPSGTLTISKIADLLDITEKDVIRALNYWKKICRSIKPLHFFINHFPAVLHNLS